VLQTIGDGVVLLDSDDRTQLYNTAAEAITGLSASEVLGRTPSEFISGWDEIKQLIPLASAPGVAGASHAETVPLEINGRELWLSISAVATEEGTVFAFRDLTEEHHVEQLRADFLATVSHELRTPLAAIYGAAVTIRRTDVELQETTRDRLLQVIAQESERLARIVEDVLLASHLDSGRMQHRIEAVDAALVARGVLEAAETHLPENVQLELLAPADLPPVAADEGQLRQVFVNLLDNAIKYSPDGGGVVVKLEAQARSVRVAVADEGLGIPPGERRRIFEKFYRLDPNMTRGIGGTGLGLYICRELVRRVDGRIWVESRPGAGSTFFVELPVPKEARRANAPTAPKQAVRTS
jgi:two-component system phosphate regulon sensor histidine kinase PhoR